jgi:Reverse transcriptase (RNA-dependent DNA polymerase)
MSQPLGFVDPEHPNHVCRLSKALYGLKQPPPPRAWFHTLSSALLAFGFIGSHYDPSLFVYHANGYTVIILIYVNDIIITSNSSSVLLDVIIFLQFRFAIKYLGSLKFRGGSKGAEVDSTPLIFQKRSKNMYNFIKK